MLRGDEPIRAERECERAIETCRWLDSAVDGVIGEFLSRYLAWYNLLTVGEAHDTQEALAEHRDQDVDAAQRSLGQAQDMQDAAADAGPPERKIQILEDFYEFRDHAAISSFLRANHFLIDLLFEAHDKIQEVFGRNTQVALELFADPEAEAAEELFVLIITALSPGDAASGLGSLDEEWWLEASSKAHCLLNLDVEMV